MESEDLKYFCSNCGTKEDYYLKSELIKTYGIKSCTEQYHVTAKCRACNCDIQSKEIYELNAERYRRELEILSVHIPEWSVGKYNSYKIIVDMKCRSGCSYCLNKYSQTQQLVLEKLKDSLKEIGKMEKAELIGHNLLCSDNTIDLLYAIRGYVKRISMITCTVPNDIAYFKQLVMAGLDEITLKLDSVDISSSVLSAIFSMQKHIPRLILDIDCELDAATMKSLLSNSSILIFHTAHNFKVCKQILTSETQAYRVTFANEEHISYNFKSVSSYADIYLLPIPTERNNTGNDIYITPVGDYSAWDNYCMALDL